MEIDDFIQAIIEEPDVDDHRVIFADYLEEHDDPRADLIRLQFEMKALKKSDSKWTPLRSRELKLLKKHGGFGKPPKIGRILAWHGGFVDEIETTLAQLATKNEELLAKTTVRAVQVKSDSKQFKKLFDSPYLHRLRKLTFKNNHVPNHEMCEFLALPTLARLKELYIGNGDMNNDVARTIGRMKHFESLESLELSGSYVDSISAKAIAECTHLNNLKSLSLNHAVCDEAALAIAGAEKFQSMTQLELTGDISDKSVISLHKSTFHATLEELTLHTGDRYYHPQGAAPVEFSAGFDNPFPNLKSLAIGSGLPDNALVEVAKHYRNLESLDVGGNLITDVGAEALAKSELLSSLKRLVLTNNQITIRGVEMIRESEYWNGKTKVYLRSNRFSRGQAKAIKEKYGKTFGNLGPDWDHWF